MRHDASASSRSRRALSALAALAMASGVAACAQPTKPAQNVVAVQPASAPKVQTGGGVIVDLPALAGKPVRPDVLVTGRQKLSPSQVRQVIALTTGAVTFSGGNLLVGRQGVRVASVDPASFRRYAAPGTAESTAVWQVVAGGGLVASHEIARKLGLQLGRDVVVTGPNGQPMPLRLGALATTGIPGTELIVDRTTGIRLGMTGPTAVLLHAGSKDPVSLAAKVRKVAGSAIEVDLLSAPSYNPVAFLTGSKAAKAFGAFSYKYYPDGTIEPDARWVAANITSATVPIFGRVTCHRLMIPQLRGALQDVVNAGLSGSLQTYNGCYVPRFIERNPSRSVSLHTWGIAVDFDAATNYRGIAGTMNPQVVTIFKRWGFRWGGDWSYTDPMHFELGALLTSSPKSRR